MPHTEEQLSTVQDLMRRFKVSDKTVRRWVKSGEIEVVKLGRQLRFEEKEIKRYMDLRRRAAKRKQK
jgi:excisionase family DNA binding protein